MKICIDTDLLVKKEYRIDEFCYLLALKLGYPITEETVNHATNWGNLDFDAVDNLGFPVNPRINENSEEYIHNAILESEIQETTKTGEDRYMVLADKLREIYPKGKKEGTNYQWRDSTSIIAKKLKAVVRRYGKEFTDEEAVNACKAYVASFNGDYRYMQLLKYFISKAVLVDGIIEENSQLLSYIENQKDSPEQTPGVNWLDELV
jgi:hypothetical protein